MDKYSTSFFSKPTYRNPLETYPKPTSNLFQFLRMKAATAFSAS